MCWKLFRCRLKMGKTLAQTTRSFGFFSIRRYNLVIAYLFKIMSASQYNKNPCNLRALAIFFSANNLPGADRIIRKFSLSQTSLFCGDSITDWVLSVVPFKHTIVSIFTLFGSLLIACCKARNVKEIVFSSFFTGTPIVTVGIILKRPVSFHYI